MTLHLRAIEEHTQARTSRERAAAYFLEALEACERNDLRAALRAGMQGKLIVETELQFRDARRGGA